MRKTVPPSPLAKLIITKNISKNKKDLARKRHLPKSFLGRIPPVCCSCQLGKAYFRLENSMSKAHTKL
jgi:hypothetical protein